MQWSRAVHHVAALAESCAQMLTPPVVGLRVTQLWAVGDILGERRELETVTLALGVDLPPEEVPWWVPPRGAEHWANATRLSKNPVIGWWRSTQAPVWNHRIVRPALVWDAEDGVRDDVVEALRTGNGEAFRAAAPTADEVVGRLRDELAVSLAALRGATETFEERRWGRGRLEPIADALWEASSGYLDVLQAVSP